MAKLSANYAVLYIIDPTMGEEETAALIARFKELAQPGDLILTVGAGDIYRAGEKLLETEA